MEPSSADEAAAPGDGRDGAEVRFSGRVRDEQRRVRALYLEHYPGMTEKVLHRIAAHAQQRWPLNTIDILHRVGEIGVGEEIVRVTVCAAHRQAAFEACLFLIDTLKSQAPLWKKELAGDGWRWVEARQSDAEAACRWMTEAPEKVC